MAGNKNAASRSSKATTARNAHDSPESDAPPNSQASEDLSLQSIMAKMLDSSRRRRETREKSLQTEYGKRVDKVRDEIDKRFDEHQTKVQDRHKRNQIQIQNLLKLQHKKLAIEARIAEDIRKLEVAYLERAQELQAVLNARVEDLISCGD